MKLKKNIFAIVNLMLFIGSLLFSTFNGFSESHPNIHNNQSKQIINAKQSGEDGGCSQMLCEKIETETEHDLHEQATLLPFSITYFNLASTQFLRISTQPIAEKLSNPIYVSVCNFRI